jgi:hypothetical protein
MSWREIIAKSRADRAAALGKVAAAKAAAVFRDWLSK